MAKQKGSASPPSKITTPSTSPEQLSSITPPTSLYPLLLESLSLLNSLLLALAYILLIFQTVYILSNKQPKYINLRHITLKWLLCLFIYQIKSNLVPETSSTDKQILHIYILHILMDLFIVVLAYPSKLLKTIHLKYFSHNQHQKYNEVLNDGTYNIGVVQKIVISIVVFLLTLCKHGIALVMPQHRKRVKQVLREVNAVVIDKKCFWSIYDEGNQGDQESQQQKVSTKQFLMSASNVQSPSSKVLNLKSSNTFFPSNQGPYSSRDRSMVVKARGQLCRVRSNGLKPFKKVSLKYTAATSQLQICDIETTRIQFYILEEVSEKPENIVEMIVMSKSFKQSEPIYIKFNSYRQMQSFLRSIEEGEKIIDDVMK